MSCVVCSRVIEKGKAFLEGDWLYDNYDGKFNGALTLRLYLVKTANNSVLMATLEGTEIEHPILSAKISFNYCPFCGGKING